MLTFKLYPDKPGVALGPAPLRACDQCRRRRLRCDRGKPCACCKRVRAECSYVSVPKPRGRRPRTHSRDDSSASPSAADDSFNAFSRANVPDPDHHTGMPSTNQLQSLKDISVNDWADFRLDDSVNWETLPTILGTSADWVTSTDSPQTSNNEEAPLEDSGFIGSPQNERVDTSVGIDPSTSSSSSSSPPSQPPQSQLCERVIGRKTDVRLCLTSFIPFVDIFFERLYAVFPVIDKSCVMELLQSDDPPQPLPASFYPFLAALAAAVIVQLNATDTEILQPSASADTPPSPIGPTPRNPSADFFVSHCLQTRWSQGFIENPNEWTVLTSFFLFAYYGNLDRSRSAWYYLREAIGFAQALGLDDTESYVGMDLSTLQRRQRLFWLLFVTERAYSLQHRRRPLLRPTIELPRVFEAECPKLIFGFVTLAKLFSTIDEDFMAAWVDQTTLGNNNGPSGAIRSMSKLLDQTRAAGIVSPSEIDEIQRLDIAVTQQWLRVLTCRLNMRQLSQNPSSTGHRATYGTYSQYVAESSRNLLHTITSASRECLEAHGIGMEQKVSDVATCLCDVLMNVDMNEMSADFFSANDYLHHFMIFLAGFRSHESQYLEPLAQKASIALRSRVNPWSVPNISGEVTEHNQTNIYDDTTDRWGV